MRRETLHENWIRSSDIRYRSIRGNGCSYLSTWTTGSTETRVETLHQHCIYHFGILDLFPFERVVRTDPLASQKAPTINYNGTIKLADLMCPCWMRIASFRRSGYFIFITTQNDNMVPDEKRSFLESCRQKPHQRYGT